MQLQLVASVCTSPKSGFTIRSATRRQYRRELTSRGSEVLSPPVFSLTLSSHTPPRVNFIVGERHNDISRSNFSSSLHALCSILGENSRRAFSTSNFQRLNAGSRSSLFWLSIYFGNTVGTLWISVRASIVIFSLIHNAIG